MISIPTGSLPGMDGHLAHPIKCSTLYSLRTKIPRIHRCLIFTPHSNHRPAPSIPTATSQPSSSTYNDYFSEEWGIRWPYLAQSLAQRTQHTALINGFIPQESIDSLQISSLLSVDDAQQQTLNNNKYGIPAISTIDYKLPLDDTTKYPPPIEDPVTKLLAWYWLDPASLVPPLLLAVETGHTVLDMCAAPGGKSLVLALLLFYNSTQLEEEEQQVRDTTSLICNEVDVKRKKRLVSVLKTYVPGDIIQRHIKVSGRDGKQWGTLKEEEFDRILIDAPCSSDRHVLQQSSSPSKADWNLSRCKSLAKEQTKLILSGLKALKIGGILVYSTCSIAALENDNVVQTVLGKMNTRNSSVEVISHTINAVQEDILKNLGAEKTQHGWLILPDTAGYGPIYVAVLYKACAVDTTRVKINKYSRDDITDTDQ